MYLVYVVVVVVVVVVVGRTGRSGIRSWILEACVSQRPVDSPVGLLPCSLRVVS